MVFPKTQASEQAYLGPSGRGALDPGPGQPEWAFALQKQFVNGLTGEAAMG